MALVAPSLDIPGGQAVQAQLLRQHLNEVEGLHVELLPINPRLPGPFRFLQRVKYLRTLATSGRYMASLAWRLRRYDVVHVFSASYLSFLLAPAPALLMSRLMGRPTVLNYRSGEADDHLRRWRRTAVPVMRLADRIVTPSGYLVDVFARHGLGAESIPNFVDLDRFRFRERRAPKPVFLSNRSFEAHYDVACTLRAFQTIQARHPEARLLAAGDGPLRAELEALAERLGLRQVEFLGRVEHERMPDLYDRADIYVNTPRIDNMPNSILEAHAAGLPVVTTNAGGIPYIIRDGETALMVEAGDCDAVAAAALRLLDDPALARRLARNGLEECRARYSWPKVRRQWTDLYRTLAGPLGSEAS